MEKKELTPREEVEVFFPKNFEKVVIKGKSYDIHPPTLDQWDILMDLEALDFKKMSKQLTASLATGIAGLLGEEDVAFIRKSVDILLIRDIFQKVRRATNQGISEQPAGVPAKAEPPAGER
jgi:hypothetical protein